MVTGIRRSQSLHGGSATCSGPSRSLAAEKKAFHARSTSLPNRSHPALARFDDHIFSLRSLPPPPDYPDQGGAATWLADGLDRINGVHAALDGILHLPRPADTPLVSADLADRLLDDALCLADAYASLLSATSDLKHHVAEARAALRRGDFTRLSSAVRSHRRAEKVLARLAVAIKKVTRASSHHVSFENMANVGVGGIIREAIVATASASAAIVDGLAAMSSSASAATASNIKDSSTTWSLKRLTAKKKGRMEEEAAEVAAMEKLQGLEMCVERFDEGSEKVFRSLVNTRVSLLNILTPSL